MSDTVSSFFDALLLLPDVIFFEIIQHIIFLGSLLLCLTTKCITGIFLYLTWTYTLFSEIFKDRDRLLTNRSRKRRGVPPIQAYSYKWNILTAYQLNHMWSSAYSKLFACVHASFDTWNILASEWLFHVQTYAYPVAPQGHITNFIMFVISTYETTLCILFGLLDLSWIFTTFLMHISYRISCSIVQSLVTYLLTLPSPIASYRNRITLSWRTKMNYITPHDNVYCFLTDDAYELDREAIRRCFNAQTNRSAPTRISFFTKNPECVYVDNCANTHISNNRDHFVDFAPVRRGSRDKVSTVGGNALPSGEGTVKWSWRDDNGRSHTHTLRNCRYYPNSPACILSPSQLGIQLKDIDGGTGIDSSVKISPFYWKNKQYSRTIHHTSSFMPKLEINDTKTTLASYLSIFEAFFDDSSKFAFLTADEFRTTFSSEDNKLSTLGRRVIYRKNNLKLRGMIAAIASNQSFEIRLDDGSEVTTTHDFIQFDKSLSADDTSLPDQVVHDLK